MSIPTLSQAEAYLQEAGRLNPGPWVDHVRYVAGAARRIASAHPTLDPEEAYILGLLHDIGRRYGPSDMRHTLDGYNFLSEEGFPGAARICLTHSFPVKTPYSGAGKWDCTPQELQFVQSYLDGIVYDRRDELIMLCDCLALPTGFCLIEKRLVDVALRHGFNDYTLEKWRAFFAIQAQIEAETGRSIYDLLPGVVENTFAV